MYDEESMDFIISKVSDGFWILEQKGVRCFLIEGEYNALLIDSGWGGDLRQVCSQLTSLPIQLVLTHADVDHAGTADQFDQICMHPAEFPTYVQLKGNAEKTCPVWEGEVLEAGDYRLEVILIPGHTPGSIALLDREKRILFSGDTVSEELIYMYGKNRSMEAYAASLEKLWALRDCFDRIFPAHGPVVIPPEQIKILYDAAVQICQGNRPEGEAFEDSSGVVKLYTLGKAQFALEQE